MPAATPDNAAETERVIVTGSYIPTQTAAEVGPNPVLVVDRYTIEKSGERAAEELIKHLPVANANGVPISGNAGNLGQGSSSISLRGFDPGATLVLLNGHRIAPYPTGTTFGTQVFIDLSSIPRPAIESIEILKDGASTTYGADAVAGVVNLKLRHDYRGAEVNVEYGNTTEKDSGEVAASVVFGVGNDKTNLTGVANYYRRNSIFRRDRDYDREVPAALVTTNSSPYNLEVTSAAAEAAAGRPITEVPADLDTFFAHAPFFSNGNAPASDYTYTEGRSAHFPFHHYAGEFPDTERYGAYVIADHKIFGDAMVGYADVFYQRVDSLNQQAPAVTGSFQTAGVRTVAIPPHAPGATLGGPTAEETGLPPGAYNPFNPFQQIIAGGSRGRLFEFGNRKFDTLTSNFFATAGLRGDKLFDGSWGYDAAFRYSRIESTLNYTFPSTTRFNRILNAADPIFDPASPEYVGTTVPFNPFGDYRMPIANNQKLADYALIHPREFDLGTLITVDLNIYTTKLLSLPAGGVGLAFGGQFGRETNDQNPGSFQLAGDLVGGGLYVAVHGKRENYAGFAETSIPIFGSNFHAPGFHALEFTAAIRFEEFGNNSSNVMVPKFGLRWQPFDDSLTLRATWGEGYRQPTLVELFAPPIVGPQDVFDPVQGAFVSEVPTTFLPNPNLQPEDSRNFSAGIVYSPNFVPGLTVTVDLFDIETTGWVNPVPDPTLIVERIAAGRGLPGESVTRDANGNLVALTEVTFVNSGSQKARGADFGIVYQLQTSFGTFTSTTQATFLDSFQFASTAGETELELRSSPVDGFSEDAYLKWKGIQRLDWAWRGLGLAATATYRDGFHEFDVNGNEHWVRQTWFFDVQASYEFRFASAHPERTWQRLLDRTSVTVGCTNIFDHDPPRSVDNFPRYIYDPTGRFVYVGLTKKF